MSRKKRNKSKSKIESGQTRESNVTIENRQSKEQSVAKRNIIGGIFLAGGAIPVSYVNFFDPSVSVWLSFLGSFLMVIGLIILASPLIKRKIWYTLFVVPLAILFYYSFQKSQTSIFNESVLDNPVSKFRILLVFKNPYQLDSLRHSEMHFILRGVGGRLELKTNIFDVTDREDPGPLQVYGPKVVIPNWFVSIVKNPNSKFPEKNFIGLKKLLTDTLSIEIKLDGNTPLPFQVFRDFKGMFVIPYFTQDIVNILKEMMVEVNELIILRGQADKVNWMPVQYHDENRISNLFVPVMPRLTVENHVAPEELWQIDLVEPL